MFIKIKSAFGRFKANDIVDVEDSIARVYVEDGLAEEAEAAAREALKNVGLADLSGTLKSFTDELAKAFADAMAEIKKAAPKGTIEPGPQQADKSKSIGDFTVNVFKAANTQDLDGMAAAQKRLREDYGSEAKKGMEEATGTTGGYWTLPVEFSDIILEQSWDGTFMLPGSTNIPLGTRAFEIGALDQYQVPTPGNSAQFAGMTVSRKGEVSRRDQSQPSQKKIKLEANDLTAMTEYSRDLNADAGGALSTMLTRLISGALGFRRDWEHIWGVGSGQCLGFMNAKALMAIARQAAGKIAYQDINAMIGRLMPGSESRACWLAHPYLREVLRNITDQSGRLIFLPTMTSDGGPITKGGAMQLANIPILFNEKAAAPGSKGDLSLVDRKAYLTGQRSGVEIGLSEHFLFDTDQIALRAKIRDDGQPWVIAPITLADGTDKNQVSPFITLDVPAAAPAGK